MKRKQARWKHKDFVVKEGAIDIFADKIDLLSKDKAMRVQMGRQVGREFVAQNFETKILGNRLVDIYENC